jgi:hypothetical protein
MAQAKKSAKKSARRPAKAARAKTPSKVAAKGAKSDVVYSDVRRDALAWQLSRLR